MFALRCAVGIVALLAVSSACAGIAWGTDVDRALREAKEGNLPVLAEVYADWCLPCKVMEYEVWSRAEVVEAARGFVNLRVDADTHEAFVDRHSAEVLPTTLVLDDAGAEIARISGLAGAARVVEVLGRARAGWTAYSRDRLLDGDAEALERSATYLMSLGNAAGAATRLEHALEISHHAHAPAQQIEQLELRLAQARLAGDHWHKAAPVFERLSQGAAGAATRGWALAGLADVRERQGRDAEAAELRRRLSTDHPEIARALGAAR